MKPGMFLCAAIGAALLVSAAGTSAGQGDHVQGDHVMSDHQFLNEAARGSLAEITLGQMAETRARNPQVKQFAARMIADHSEALSEARQIAERSGVQITQQMTQKHEKMAESLSKKSPDAFDQAYMQAMVEDHRSTIGQFEAYVASGDGHAAAYAEKHLPVVREHLSIAESIVNEL